MSGRAREEKEPARLLEKEIDGYKEKTNDSSRVRKTERGNESEHGRKGVCCEEMPVPASSIE